MDKNIAIKLENVSKKFKRGRKLLLKEALLDLFKLAKQEDFWALQKINFQIKKGEAVGIVGANGSGKSTILKLIAGVLTPTSGSITVQGKIGPLIELGAGFHPELTGRENIYLNGTILGLSIKEIDDKFDRIVDFSELSDFIDTPVKHYSSGMYMRLGFSIAIHIDPEILLIDEVLMVGDAAFQGKSFNVFDEFKKNGKTIILISHDLGAIKSVCSKIMVLKKGQLIYFGKISEGISIYNKIVSEHKVTNIEKVGEVNKKYQEIEGHYNRGVKIIKVWLEDEKGRKTQIINTSYFFVKLKLQFNEDSIDPNPGVIIKNHLGVGITASNSDWRKIKLGKFRKNTEAIVIFKFQNIYEEGKYTIDANCFHKNKHTLYDYLDDAIQFYCQQNFKTGAMVNPKYEVYLG